MKHPFGDAADARYMARNPLEDADTASLRRLLATRAEFSDLSRLSDAQVRAHVAALSFIGRLPAAFESAPEIARASVEPTPKEQPATPAVIPEKDSKKKCWIEDYEKEISTASYGRYSQPFKANGTPHAYTDKVQYKIYVPAKTGGAITVEIKFKVEAQGGTSTVDVTAAKTKLENGVSTHWSGKYTLEADDPECGKKSFRIDYKVAWVSSGQHYTVKVHATYPREGVTGSVMNVEKATSAWTYAHEVAHCFGLPDEYSYTADIETVKYFKPDGTLDAAISAPPGGKAKTAADATIMSAVDNTKTLPRHAWYVAIEAQALLTAKLGRTIKCNIK